MVKKAYYAITLIIAIGLCFALVCFPVLKYNKDSINKNARFLINTYIEKGYTENESIDLTIDEISKALQIFGNIDAYKEDGSVDYDLLNMTLSRLRNKGIKYIDLVSGIKNQVEYNSKLRKALKADETLTRKEKSAQLKANRINPFTFITLVITIALVFASAFLIIIRSIKGLLELKKVKLFRISLFGTIVSLGLIMLPYIFKKQITEITYPSQYVNLFISCVSGSALCYYYFFGFLICLILSIIAKFAKRERKF